MPRSVALTGLIIVVSLSMVGFAAFSSGGTVAPTGIDLPGIDASVAGAVFATPLVPLAEPEPIPVQPPEPTQRVPLGRSALEPLAATTTTSPPPRTTTTTTPPTKTTKPPTTTATVPATVPATTVPPTTVPPTTTPPTTSWPPAVEQWRGLVSGYFSVSRIEEALAIISCESKGDANASNSSSGAAGLFQFIASTWNSVAGEAGLDTYASGAPYNPSANIAAAAWLVQNSIDTNHGGGPWGHWSCRRVLG